MDRYRSKPRRPRVQDTVCIEATDVAFAFECGAPHIRFSYTYRCRDDRLDLQFSGALERNLDGLELALTLRCSALDPERWPDGATRRHQLVSTPCPFGGVRWWFLCPKCRVRRRALWFSVNVAGFACRQCLSLAYQSQLTSYREPSSRGETFIRYFQHCRIREQRYDRAHRYRVERRKRRRVRTAERAAPAASSPA